MASYVLGVDSGGTKFLVRAAALDGTILGEYRGSTCSHYNLGAAAAAERVLRHVKACLAAFGGAPEDCACIVCGSTGYDSPEDGSLLADLYGHLEGFRCPVCCMNDVELAHYTVTGGVGLLTLAGTGSIVFGRNRRGEERRVGGWMKSIRGEEGSGRYLDAKALHHYSRFLDGCRPDSPLLREIEAVVGAPTRKALMDYAVRLATPPWPSANLGQAVNRAAEAGDPYAQAILREAAFSLCAMTDDAIHALGMERETPLCVGLWGSVLLNCRIEQEEFCRLLRLRYPQAVIRTPTEDAAQGAVEIALRWHAAGGDCRDVLRSKSRRAS